MIQLTNRNQTVFYLRYIAQFLFWCMDFRQSPCGKILQN